MNTCIQKWTCPHYHYLFRSCSGLFNYFYSTVFLVNKSTPNIHCKHRCWSSILWPLDVKNQLIGRSWCWERVKAREGGDRGWDGWMASPTQWTWVWVNSQRCQRTGKPGVLKFMVSQRLRHDLATEQNKMFCFQKQNVRNHGLKISLYLSPCSVIISQYSFSFSSFLKEL